MQRGSSRGSRGWSAALAILGLLLLWTGSALAADIGGTVTLPNGVTTGRVYLKVYYSGGGETPFGKSVSVNPTGPTTYNIRGNSDGTYVVAGFLDEKDLRVPFTTAALGASATVTITGGVASGPANLTLAYPQSTPTASLQGLDIMPASTKLLVFARMATDNLGFVNADHVSICYDTDQNFSAPTYPTNLQNIPVTGREINTVVSGLQNGTTYYFRATPSLNAVDGTPVTGSGTPSLPGAGSTVSGTVNLTFAGTQPPAGTKVWIALANDQIPGVQQPTIIFDYFTLNQDGVSADFTMPGVPDGPFFIYALVDLNGNDIIEMGEPRNTDSNTASLITAAGQNLPGQSFTITDAPMSVRVTTQHQRLKNTDTYNVNFEFGDGTKRPINITLSSINQTPIPPMDLGLTQWGGFQYFASNLGFRPQPSDTFDCLVRFLGDASGGNPFSASANTVLDTFATPTSPSGYLLNNLRPDFTWSNPANPPAYYSNYFKLESVTNQNAILLYPASYDMQNNLLPGGTTSVAYPLVSDLSYDQLYQWTASVVDMYGNQADEITEFIPVTQIPPTLPPVGIGAYLDGDWYLDKNDNGTWEPGTDFYGSFGSPTMLPVVGDWNGDGYTELGVYDNGTWYFDWNGNGFWDGEPTDHVVVGYGYAGTVPVVGDWDGTGTTKIGVYDPNNNIWYLDYNGNSTYDPGTDIAQQFGFAGCIPVVGDWSGNGHDKIGVYYQGQWYLDTNGSFSWDGADSYVPNFGFAGALPLIGDWTNNGTDRIGVYYDGAWYLDLDNSRSWDSANDRQIGSFGDASMTPVVGIWH